MSIMQTMLSRVDGALAPPVAELLRPGHESVRVDVSERPPMLEVASYRDRRAASSAS
jgi:hypothetical protein